VASLNEATLGSRLPHFIPRMNSQLILLTLLSTICAVSFASDKDVLNGPSAQIKVLHMEPVPLAVGSDAKGWAKIPDQLASRGAVIFMPSGNTDGVAVIEVTGDGILLLACNFDYQGNSSGDWKKDLWSQRNFRTRGWKQMSQSQLGGELVKGDKRAQVIFSKHVRKGDAFRLRCNKYDPPFAILLKGNRRGGE
jgi:hypothetical protein